MPFTVKTVDVANALRLAASKADTLVTALELIRNDLPEGRTWDVVDRVQYYLGEVQDDLTTEANVLDKHGDAV